MAFPFVPVGLGVGSLFGGILGGGGRQTTTRQFSPYEKQLWGELSGQQGLDYNIALLRRALLGDFGRQERGLTAQLAPYGPAGQLQGQLEFRNQYLDTLTKAGLSREADIRGQRLALASGTGTQTMTGTNPYWGMLSQGLAGGLGQWLWQQDLIKMLQGGQGGQGGEGQVMQEWLNRFRLR